MPAKGSASSPFGGCCSTYTLPASARTPPVCKPCDGSEARFFAVVGLCWNSCFTPAGHLIGSDRASDNVQNCVVINIRQPLASVRGMMDGHVPMGGDIGPGIRI